MAPLVCPWWLGPFLASPLRRLVQDPARLLVPYVREGMTVLEPGPGMGFFTLDLARLAGPRGRVVAIDVQPKMLRGLERRARRAGLMDRIETRLATPTSLGTGDLAGRVDLVCAFAVVHELPDVAAFFREVAATLAPDGTVLLVEPRGHVNPRAFADELAAASAAGLRVIDNPSIRRSHAAVLAR